MTLTFQVTCDLESNLVCWLMFSGVERLRKAENQNKNRCSSVTRIRVTKGHVALVNKVTRSHVKAMMSIMIFSDNTVLSL